MKARLIKETRSLLPFFAVMVLAAVTPPLIWHGPGHRDAGFEVGFMLFVTTSALLAAASLGNEFHWRTLSALFAQPVTRRRLWGEKMLVLGLTLTAGYGIFLICSYVPEPRDDFASHLMLGLVPLGALCGAPFISMLSKNIVGTAILAVLLPTVGFGLLAALASAVAHYFPPAGAIIVTTYDAHTLAFNAAYGLLYCAASAWFGYSTFMRLQIADSQVRDLALPPAIEGALARPLRRLVPGYTGPWASLFRKELQLHRPSFIVAGVALITSPVLVLAWRLFRNEFTTAISIISPVLCVFLIPILATTMSVAEERNLGVAAWQIIQPVAPWRQWTAKLLVVLFVSVTLGILLPLAGVAICDQLFALHLDFRLPHGDTPSQTVMARVLIVSLYLFFLSLLMMASSLSGTTVLATVTSLALLIAGAGVFAGVNEFMWRLEPFNSISVRFEFLERAATGAAVCLICLTQWFAFSNFRTGEPTVRRRVFQALALLAAVAFSVIIARAYD